MGIPNLGPAPAGDDVPRFSDIGGGGGVSDGDKGDVTVSAGGSVWTLNEWWCRLAADYALTNSGAEQKLFNASTNGRLTLPVGVYWFETLLYLTGMSATSGNFAFDPVGAGTAVADKFLYHTVGVDNTTPTNGLAQTGSITAAQQSVNNILSAGTGTGAVARISGTFTVTTAGTIIPSISLQTAAAATVKAGSHFRCWRAADTDVATEGPWD